MRRLLALLSLPAALSLLFLPLLFLQQAEAAALSDPTRPSGFEINATDEHAQVPLQLTLIRLGAQPLAVINGQTLKPGDRIGALRLLSVQPGRAVLVGQAGQIILPLIANLNSSSSRSKPHD